MKQIKTIVIRLSSAEEFDRRVNAAIAEGWTLVKREPLIPHSGDKYTMLYAELEKGSITEAERCCENCKHTAVLPFFEPCHVCFGHNKWEPEEVVT